MTQKEIMTNHARLIHEVVDGRLYFALQTIKGLIRQSTRTGYFYELENLEENYKNLLKYAFEGYPDPQREEILLSISAAILTLGDEVTDHLAEESFPAKRNFKSRLNQEFGTDPSSISAKIEEVFFSHEVSELIEGGLGHPSRITGPLFWLIWLTHKPEDYLVQFIRHIHRDEAVEWFEKCLVVSALTLSLLNFFDPQKFELLSEFVLSREPQVYHRALTGFVLALIRYDERVRFYPAVVNLQERLSVEEEIRKDVQTIILQLLMAGETERITKEFEEEVLPDMQKMIPKIGDKLQLDRVVEEEDPEEQNPVWKEMIDEVPGLFEKIEKFSRMQMEGGDVFMSTFSLLKRFDFFNEMSHWFIPFYCNHPAIEPVAGEDEEIRKRLMEGLEKAFYICNSDKYSFALNFKAIPSQQRTMIVTHFEAELEQMKEMASEEEILDPAMISNAIFTQYIQDLYRFYKLYPHKSEFDDVFRWKLQFNKLNFYKQFTEPKIFTEQLAAFYLTKDHWDEAVAMYSYLENMGVSSSQLYQKLGYSLQRTGRWSRALEAYQKAELFDTDRLWILKKLSWCSIRLNNFERALGYIREALKMQPEDLNLLSQAGQCHLSLKEYSQALEYYNRVWMASPGNMKALRPIAYCKFTLGNLDEAAEAYTEILESAETSSPFDFMNAGHVALCQKDRLKAFAHYKSCLAEGTLGREAFLNAFMEDAPFLINNGIHQEEIPLIIDYLLAS